MHFIATQAESRVSTVADPLLPSVRWRAQPHARPEALSKIIPVLPARSSPWTELEAEAESGFRLPIRSQIVLLDGVATLDECSDELMPMDYVCT
jgi:hypothetical protein